jgi:hypothetical protein
LSLSSIALNDFHLTWFFYFHGVRDEEPWLMAHITHVSASARHVARRQRKMKPFLATNHECEDRKIESSDVSLSGDIGVNI